MRFGRLGGLMGLAFVAAATSAVGAMGPDGGSASAALEAPAPVVLASANPKSFETAFIAVPDKRSRLATPSNEGASKRSRLPQRWRYERNEFSPLIEKYAKKNGVPVELAHAMIEIESRFRPGVRGRAGEVGLMQIKPATARMVGFRGSTKALYDPETNIKYGMRYLAKAHELGNREGVCGTILKYNAGHGARRMNRISRRYCEKVKAVFARNDRAWAAYEAQTYALLDDAPVPLMRAPR